jgi:hypothetical protein
MTIAEAAGRGKEAVGGALERVPKDWLVVGIVVLASTASFGLGMLADREMKPAPAIKIEDIGRAAGGGPAAAETAVSGAGAPAGPGGEGTVSTQGQAGSALPGPSGASGGPPEAIPAGGQVVASKTGAKYYLPWCATAKRIKPENQVWFASQDAAKAAGYEPAANCKGL